MNKFMSFLNKNSTTFLTITSAIGVVTSIIFSVRAYKKSEEEITETEKNLGEELSKKQKTKIRAKHYILPAAVGTATIGSIIGTEVINGKRLNVAVKDAAKATETAIAAENAYRIIKDEMEKVVTPEQKDEIMSKILESEEKMKRHYVGEYVPMEKLYPCRDVALNTPAFYSNKAAISEAWTNFRNERIGGFGSTASVAEFYDILGIQSSPKQSNEGWTCEQLLGMERLQFYCNDEPGIPTLCFEYIIDPTTLPDSEFY